MNYRNILNYEQEVIWPYFRGEYVRISTNYEN